MASQLHLSDHARYCVHLHWRTGFAVCARRFLLGYFILPQFVDCMSCSTHWNDIKMETGHLERQIQLSWNFLVPDWDLPRQFPWEHTISRPASPRNHRISEHRVSSLENARHKGHFSRCSREPFNSVNVRKRVCRHRGEKSAFRGEAVSVFAWDDCQLLLSRPDHLLSTCSLGVISGCRIENVLDNYAV